MLGASASRLEDTTNVVCAWLLEADEPKSNDRASLLLC
jgi:hypothetical protein